jgi:hypothetical protein
MYVSLSIMKPNPGHEGSVIDSMHRFGEAAGSQPGLTLVTTLRDPGSGDLVGLAVWESAEAAHNAGPVLADAVKDDDFGTWVADMRNLKLGEV